MKNDAAESSGLKGKKMESGGQSERNDILKTPSLLPLITQPPVRGLRASQSC